MTTHSRMELESKSALKANDMTVVYSPEVATVSFFGFIKLLVRWHGSIYKLLWQDFLLFAGIYTLLAIFYHQFLVGIHKSRFQEMIEYCNKYQDKIPLSFVLGFYVSAVMTRWWEQFNSLPWPTRLAMMLTSHIRGQDERSRMIRRTIIRYMCLGYVMTMASISVPVRKRFPTMNHLVEAGFMLPNEQQTIDLLFTPYNKYYIPFVWAATLVGNARKEGRINNDYAFQVLVDEINAFRGNSQKLFNSDWVTIPLVYTQVATLAVYTFFFAALVGRQYYEKSEAGDLIFPFFTMLQFFFYMGWLKVAEEMLNPFGEDDDDFDINMLIDKNLKTSYIIVDEMHEEVPELIKDQYWDKTEVQIPYTEAALEHYKGVLIGSADNIEVPENQRQFVTEVPSVLSLIKEVDEGESSSQLGSKHGMKVKAVTSKSDAKLHPSDTDQELSSLDSKSSAKMTLREKIFGRKDSLGKAAKVKDAQSAESVSSKRSKEREVGGRRESLKQVADRRDSKASSKGSRDQDVLRRSSEPTESTSETLLESTLQPQEPEVEEPVAAPQLSEAMVDSILSKLSDLRARQSRLI